MIFLAKNLRAMSFDIQTCHIDHVSKQFEGVKAFQKSDVQQLSSMIINFEGVNEMTCLSLKIHKYSVVTSIADIFPPI